MMAAWQAVRTVTDILRVDAGPVALNARLRAAAWARPLALANAHMITPALYARLAAAGELGGLPPDVRGYLAHIHRSNGRRNRALRGQILELVAALNAAGVRPMLLKGGLALLTGIYADPAARMIRDVDILVSPETVGTTIGVLRRLGYIAAVRYEPGHNAYGEFTRRHDPGAVDLHLELVEAPYLLPACEVWRRVTVVEAMPDAAFFVPAPADMALHHVLHAQVHHLGNFYRGALELRQLYEFAVLVERSSDIDWDAMHERLARRRLGIVLESYALAARHLFGCRWPLAQAPSKRANFHCRRCLVQLCWPSITWAGIPLANLWAAFAWHRMEHLYARGRSVMIRRLHHAAQFIRKKPARAAIGRLFRAH